MVIKRYFIKSEAYLLELEKKSQEINKLNKKIGELEYFIAQTEIKSLENQIKPHFLFNTLNLVARLIYLDEKSNSLEVVYALSKLLRYALEKKELVRLRDEIEYIKNYLFIQQNRYGEQLKYQLDISQNILGCLLPTLSLQPLVDNAIKHGLEPKGGGSIKIYGRQEGEKVILKVIDDGIGISEAKDFLNKPSQNSKSLGTGLLNIEKRLKFYFGEECELKRDFQHQGGSEVSIIIPFKSDNEDNYIPVFWFDK